VLNKKQLWFVPPALALVALAMWLDFDVGVGQRSRALWYGAVLVWAAKIVWEWRRLKRINPDEYV
jgi:hypothetical protein